MRAIMSRHIGLPRVRLRPPVGNAGAADERDAAVDDQQLAVGAVVRAARGGTSEAAGTARRGSPPPAAASRDLRGTRRELPIASITTVTRTPARARSAQRLDERRRSRPVLKM